MFPWCNCCCSVRGRCRLCKEMTFSIQWTALKRFIGENRRSEIGDFFGFLQLISPDPADAFFSHRQIHLTLSPPWISTW
ncbi:hypothetical protein LINPERHAP1_LOCUS32047 [Linum perenne]